MIGEKILIKATIKDYDSNPHGAAIYAEVKGNPNITYPTETKEIFIHRLDREYMLLCPSFPMAQFILAMEDKLNKKQDEYGDSWKKMPLPELVQRLRDEYKEFHPLGTTGKPEMEELIDIANICMMLYARIKSLQPVDWYCDICKTTESRIDDGYLQTCNKCDWTMERVEK